MLFTELPLLRAARRGQGGRVRRGRVLVAVPDRRCPPTPRSTRSSRPISDAGVQLVGLNFFAGDLRRRATAGVVSCPARSGEFRDNVDVAVGIGERLGCRAFNALYGNRVDGVDRGAQDELATENLALAAKRRGPRSARTVLVEPVSGAEAATRCAPRPTSSRSSTGSRRPVRRNVGFSATCTTWPPTATTSPPRSTRYADRIGHVQIADAPGRGEPGTGDARPRRLPGRSSRRPGYAGWVGLEYKPTDGDRGQPRLAAAASAAATPGLDAPHRR